MSHLSKFFRQRRVEKKLGLGGLARLLGYTNVSRGANRIQVFEGGGKVSPELLGKLAEALEIGPDEIRKYVDEDRRDWEAKVDQPIEIHLVIRLMPAVYKYVRVPDDSLDPELAAFASRMALESKSKVCLALSQRESLWFDAEGRACGRTFATPKMPNEPYAVIGGKRVQFDFAEGVTPRQIDRPGG
jgi:hypothetical protein